MPEIIPNWHPIFVHFTVALFSLAAGLFVITPFIKPPLQDQWRIVARWALWFGAGITVITGLSGWYAYSTVAHDAPSHAAMTEHRNWALAAIILFLSLAVWSALRARRNQIMGASFVGLMAVAAGLLGSTAWHGGELVYRYGLGVMSLPKTDTHQHGAAAHGAEGHAHAAGASGIGMEGMPGMDMEKAPSMSSSAQGHDDGHAHAHDEDMNLDGETGVMNEAVHEAGGHDDGHAH